MQNVSATDTSFDYKAADASWQSTPQSISSLILSENRITKVVFDESKQRFVSFESLATKQGDDNAMGDISKSNGDSKKRYFVTAFKTLLVPEVLYRDDMKTALLAHQHTISENETVMSYHAKKSEAWLLYALSPILKKNLPTGEVAIPLDAAWLETLQLLHKTSTGLNVHIYIADNMLSIAFYKDDTLTFYNTFPAANAEERLYYIMFVSEQLRINPHRDTYHVAGFIKKNDETHEMLMKYIKELKLEDRPHFYSYAMPLLDIPAHIFLMLIAPLYANNKRK